MIFNWMKQRAARKATAKGLYQTALTQSRDPVFYADLGVPDTMDGRFDLLAFHSALVLGRLRQLGAEGDALAQAFFDVLFVQVDFALRESGVGDLGVPKHMAKMMKAFNGRVHAYNEALEKQTSSDMELVVARNVFRSEEISDSARVIASYGLEASSVLGRYDIEDFKGGRITFPILQSGQDIRKASHG